jgi:endogenous inhibitor of DNA gyrase (YacG/DUF329 family)
VSGDHNLGCKRIWLVIERESDNETRTVTPGPNGLYGVVEGTCPGCEVALGRKPQSEFRIATGPRIIVSRDTAKYGARCTTCNDAVGWTYAQFETLFGLEEDRAMLDRDHQRARVYR